jgi:hypothetical protein
MKGLKYLDKKGVLVNKANKRYFKDNDLCEHLKVNKKQWLCHQMKIGDQQLRVRYPKKMTTLYQDEFERKRAWVGGKTQMFNRDKEKKFFKADALSMKTTKQADFTGETVPYERVKKSRPATSYGPFTWSTSYGNTFQAWDATGYVPTLKPRENLQSVTNMPFRAVSSYRDTFKSGAGARPGTGLGGTQSGNPGGNGANGQGVQGGNHAPGSKYKHQKSQISILSSPDKKVPFTKDTTNRLEFRGQPSIERSRPIRHMDNLGNIDMHMDPKLYSTSYRTNYNNMDNKGPCQREDERVVKRRELKQLQ